VHRSQERNQTLVGQKKAQALKRDGNLACEACGFDFSTVYGARGEDFIEYNHTKPLRHLKPGTKTKLSDLALLCSNCHQYGPCPPWLSMDELRGLISKST